MKNNLASLTSLRFIAALMVLIAHSLPHWPSYQFIKLLGSIGYLGVPFFSAYLVSYYFGIIKKTVNILYLSQKD